MRPPRPIKRNLWILCFGTVIASCGGSGVTHVPASKYPLLPGTSIAISRDLQPVVGNAYIRALMVVGPRGSTGASLERAQERLLAAKDWHVTDSHVRGMFAALSSNGSIYLTMTAPTSAAASGDFSTSEVAKWLSRRQGVLLVSMAKG